MISRAARVRHICLPCRLGMQQWPPANPVRFSRSTDIHSGRRCVSDYSPQSKERIEALISGASDNIGSHSKSNPTTKRRSSRKNKRNTSGIIDKELAPWELEPDEDAKSIAPSDSTAAELADSVSEDVAETEKTLEGDLLPEQQKTTPTSPPREFRHHLLKRVNIGLDALRKPVEAIALKNPNKMRRFKKLIPDSKEELPLTGVPLDWQSVLRQETSESDFCEEVWQNIEELRPNDTTIVRKKDFERLVQSLVDGFTKAQLLAYFNRGKWDETLQDANRPSYPWIIKQSAWTAAHTNDWSILNIKEKQAVLILSSKWKLEIQEDVEGLGRTVIWVQPKVLQLIAKPPSNVLDRLSAEILDKSKSERISVKFEESRLSIYSPKYSIATTLARLDELVQTISTQTVLVDNVQAENLTESSLEELAKITKTFLQYDKIASKLTVSWLVETDTSEGTTECPSDVVLRLLVGKRTTPQHADVQLLSRTSTNKSKKGSFLTYHREKRSMAWRDKLRPWFRLASPIGTPEEKTKKPLDFVHNVRLPQPDLSSSDEALGIEATFGQVLHAEPDIRKFKSADAHRILVPVIPHPAALTQITADHPGPSTQKTAIVLNFVPDISSGQSLRNKTPHLRLHIPINPFTDLSSHFFPTKYDLKAIIPWQENDILLPEESIDVRLTQEVSINLDADQGTFPDFLRGCEFNLLQGQLRTPSSATFMIPDKWLAVEQIETSTESVTATTFLFAGLEIHQTIDMEWQGHTLRYSSIEAGQHGGQQQKLSLTAIVDGKDNKMTAQDHLQSFLTLAETIACGQHFSWDHGYKLMQERSAEEFTWDMMDTEYVPDKATAITHVEGAEIAMSDTDAQSQDFSEIETKEASEASPSDNSIKSEAPYTPLEGEYEHKRVVD